MNTEAMMQAMLGAASGAAKGKWSTMKGFAEVELQTLAAMGKTLAESLVADLADAAAEPNDTARKKQTAIATKRAELGMKNIVLAGEGVALAVEADLKLAAQDAVNAALGVLRGAINEAAGFAIL